MTITFDERKRFHALAALERLGKSPKYELTIADLLEPLYRHIGDWQKLIGVHEVQVRRSEDPARKVELLHQVAQLYEDAAGDLNASPHYFSFGGAVETARYACEAAAGRIAA